MSEETINKVFDLLSTLTESEVYSFLVDTRACGLFGKFIHLLPQTSEVMAGPAYGGFYFANQHMLEEPYEVHSTLIVQRVDKCDFSTISFIRDLYNDRTTSYEKREPLNAAQIMTLIKKGPFALLERSGSYSGFQEQEEIERFKKRGISISFEHNHR